MRPPSWTWDEGELARAFSAKTKLVVVNSPMNPTGRVLTHNELTTLASLAIKHDAYVVSDEVYEHIAFTPHTTMLGIPGMRERTLKISSAGKTFSLTGFKVGYITASQELIRVVAAAHQFLTFTVPPNLQRAVADGLAQSDKEYNELRDAAASQARPVRQRPARHRLRQSALRRHVLRPRQDKPRRPCLLHPAHPENKSDRYPGQRSVQRHADQRVHPLLLRQARRHARRSLEASQRSTVAFDFKYPMSQACLSGYCAS